MDGLDRHVAWRLPDWLEEVQLWLLIFERDFHVFGEIA